MIPGIISLSPVLFSKAKSNKDLDPLGKVDNLFTLPLLSSSLAWKFARTLVTEILKHSQKDSVIYKFTTFSKS